MKKICTLLSLVVSSPVFAQWTSVLSANTPVCKFSGKQGDPRIIEDKRGGSYIAWKDWRNNNIPDIFLQHFDKDGRPTWIIDGLNLCVDPADQSTPNLTLTEDGGVIVAWSDFRSGIERDIYAQRVDSNGIIQWGFNGAVVTDKVLREHNEKIATDGGNGAYIIWEELVGTAWDVSIQRMDAAGNRKWGVGGIKISTNGNEKINGRLQADKKGGVFATWQQKANNGEYEIYAQRLDSNGTKLWGPIGKQITNIFDAQVNPKIDPDPSIGGCYITWIDKRGGVDYDIYAQRLDSNGITQWGLNGKPVINSVSNQSAQDVISNNNVNGLVVVWKDKRNGNDDIFIQRMDKSGNRLWGTGGLPICTLPFDQVNPSIAGDQDHGVLVTWEDRGLFGNSNISGQRVDSNGVIQWATNGVVICNAGGDQSGPKNIPDGENGMIVVWEDDRILTDRNLFMQKVPANGKLSPLSTDDVSTSNQSSAYPNPFTNRIFVNAVDIEKVQLVNSIGQVVEISAEGNATGVVVTCPENLVSGLYFIHLLHKDGNRTSTSLMKK